jgi:hypothetical protein
MKKVLKNTLLAALVAIGLAGIFAGSFMLFGDDSTPESDYLQMLDKKDDKVDDVKEVKIQVKNIKPANAFGWCTYGRDGGLWVNTDKPTYKVGDVIHVVPQTHNYVFGNWIMTYKLVK